MEMLMLVLHRSRSSLLESFLEVSWGVKTYWRNIGNSRGKTDNINIQKLHRREGNMSFSDSCHQLSFFLDKVMEVWSQLRKIMHWLLVRHSFFIAVYFIFLRSKKTCSMVKPWGKHIWIRNHLSIEELTLYMERNLHF